MFKVDSVVTARKELNCVFRGTTKILFYIAAAIIGLSLLLLHGCVSMAITYPGGYSARYCRLGNQTVQGIKFMKTDLGVVYVSLDNQDSKTKVLEQIKDLLEQAQ